eukprot:7384207-Prymnesium_polylepis.1
MYLYYVINTKKKKKKKKKVPGCPGVGSLVRAYSQFRAFTNRCINPSTWEILGFRTGFYPP